MQQKKKLLFCFMWTLKVDIIDVHFICNDEGMGSFFYCVWPLQTNNYSGFDSNNFFFVSLHLNETLVITLFVNNKLIWFIILWCTSYRVSTHRQWENNYFGFNIATRNIVCYPMIENIDERICNDGSRYRYRFW